jgi:hypothetical protein
MRFDDEIKEVLKEAIRLGYRQSIPLSVLRNIAIIRKGSLIYDYYWKNYFHKFVEIAKFLGYGEYDQNSQSFKLNEKNEDIARLLSEEKII